MTQDLARRRPSQALFGAYGPVSGVLDVMGTRHNATNLIDRTSGDGTPDHRLRTWRLARQAIPFFALPT